MRPSSPSNGRTIATIAKGLSHPSRVAIVRRLADGQERMARDIVESSGLAQSTVSEHLRLLRDAGIVTSRRDGPRVWYRLRADVLHEFADVVEHVVERSSR